MSRVTPASTPALIASEPQQDRGADQAAYTDVFDQEAGEDNTDLAPLIEFLDFINNSDDKTFAAELPESFRGRVAREYTHSTVQPGFHWNQMGLWLGNVYYSNISFADYRFVTIQQY